MSFVLLVCPFFIFPLQLLLCSVFSLKFSIFLHTLYYSASLSLYLQCVWYHTVHTCDIDRCTWYFFGCLDLYYNGLIQTCSELFKKWICLCVCVSHSVWSPPCLLPRRLGPMTRGSAMTFELGDVLQGSRQDKTNKNFWLYVF